jgi:hypothetical protein
MCDLCSGFWYDKLKVLWYNRYIFYSLIKSYSEDRYQRVELVNNYYKSCSGWGIVKHGVPQGSVLGSLLFLLFINDIMTITNTKDNNNKFKLVLFADDTLAQILLIL